VRLVPVAKSKSPAERGRLLEELRASASIKACPGPSAARSQDFLYGEDGLPE
jgi:hypothetical protein